MRYKSAAGRWVILATVLGSGMAAIDATVVGIALPSIGREFHASFGALQWVVTGYALTLAALLLLGGALGDRLGRRRIFVIGTIWFMVASGACAVAPGISTLVAVRIGQGIGAALLTPGSLAILQASFVPDDRGRAIGAWSGLGGVATAAGPLLGGYLISVASWRWVFLINLPLGALVLVLSARYVPESRDSDSRGPLDVKGAACATVALAGLTYALIEGSTLGWSDPLVVTMLALGAAGGLLFFRVELTSPDPMLPLSVFRVRQFTVSNLVTFVVYAGLGGALFLLPVELQVVDRYSPFKSGTALLPVTVLMLLLSARSGRLATRIGPRLQMTVGPVVMSAGMALLARTTSDSSYLSTVLPAVLVFGSGLAVTVAPLTITAMGAVSDEHSGLASAVNNDVARVGGLIAVAVLPPLVGMTGASYLHPAQFATDFRAAILIAATLCAAGGAIAAVGVRNPGRPTEPVAAGEPEHVACFHCALDAAPITVRT